jgi:hypothetical protein
MVGHTSESMHWQGLSVYSTARKQLQRVRKSIYFHLDMYLFSVQGQVQQVSQVEAE